MSWRDGLTIKEIADQLGYTYRCRGCGQVCDGPLVRLRCRRARG
jgi:hypothetical protein